MRRGNVAIVVMDRNYRHVETLAYRLPNDRVSFWSGKYATAGTVQALCARVAVGSLCTQARRTPKQEYDRFTPNKRLALLFKKTPSGLTESPAVPHAIRFEYIQRNSSANMFPHVAHSVNQEGKGSYVHRSETRRGRLSSRREIVQTVGATRVAR